MTDNFSQDEHFGKPMISAIRLLALCQVWILIVGCGQKGPLYLPPPEPIEIPQPAVEAKSTTASPKSQTGTQNAGASAKPAGGSAPSAPAQPAAQ